MFVEIATNVWVDPARVRAVYRLPGSPVAVVVGGQTLHLPGGTHVDDVLGKLAAAVGEERAR